jgi:hypothetical protein
MTLLIYIAFLLFCMGLYFYCKSVLNETSITPTKEPFENDSDSDKSQFQCPNLLIQKGARFYLYNSKMTKVQGVNPIEFDNLEDYVGFLEWQRSKNMRCPVLFLQQSIDAQGNTVYKIRPSVTEPQGGLPPSSITQTQERPPVGSFTGPNINTSSVSPQIVTNPSQFNSTNRSLLIDSNQDDSFYNKNSYPAFDAHGFYSGVFTPLDEMNVKQQHMLYSPNPMDDNWGGMNYTQELVDAGFYKDNEVKIRVA